MLGLADRGRVLDLFDMIMRGEAASALTELAQQYSDGADPLAVLRDLAEITHWVSVIQITPEAAEDPTVSPDERARGQAMAAGLPMRSLTRMWQMLLKALEEVASAPNAMMAAEMAIIRLTHVADLPTPDDLIRKLQKDPPAGQAPSPRAPTPQGSGPSGSADAVTRTAHTGAGAQAAPAIAPTPGLELYAQFSHVVDLVRQHRDVKLLVEIETSLRLAHYAPGRIEFEPTKDAPTDLAARLSSRLQNWTGNRWAISVVSEGGAKTIAEDRDSEAAALEAEAKAHPMMAAVFDLFPTAKILEIRTPEALAAQAQAEALPEVPDEWDPFEED
jgi:DNA polymerase-3 subunit gamma/tau